MNRKLSIFLFVFVALPCAAIGAENSMVVVQAASPAPAVTTSTAPTPAPSDSNVALIKLLQEMRATNDQTLKKQQAVLQQLDQLAEAAEQMKAFSSRG